jgi:Uma2 family endonuclease
MAMPQGEHSTLQSELAELPRRSLKPSKIARAYPELRCTSGGQSIIFVYLDGREFRNAVMVGWKIYLN